MMGEVLVNAAWICLGLGIWIAILIKGSSLLGHALAEARKAQSVALIPESPEEVLLFSGKSKISALRERTTQLRADEAARAG